MPDLYYRISDPSDVRNLGEQVKYWNATGNPKANEWNVQPEPPLYDAATHRAPEWQEGQWIITPFTPDEIATATRKAWPTVADFWAEFTSAEQLAIMDSAAPSLRLLLEALRMWRGEVWSDDARVTSGLDALTTAQVITDNRRKEIIAKTS